MPIQQHSSEKKHLNSTDAKYIDAAWNNAFSKTFRAGSIVSG